MGKVLKFPHSAASVCAARSASSASFSNVTSDNPAAAAAVTIRGHQAGAMESRDFMALACETGIPMAVPNLVEPPKASMIEANEFMTASLHQVGTAVNTARRDFQATICIMKKRETLEKRQGAVLKQARKAAGYMSARAAALDNRWAESSYSAHERGTRTIGRDDAEKYIRAFRLRGAKMTPQSILFPDGHAGDPLADAYQAGWEAAMRAVAEAASHGTIPPASPNRPSKRA